MAKIKQKKIVKYLNKDFDGFKADLLEFAKMHFSDSIIDFSDASVAGMFLDLISYVGDSMSFYQDHQFNELFADTAREPKNVIRIAKQLGIKPQPPTPASVICDFFIEVPAIVNSVGSFIPNTNFLFKLVEKSTFESDSGITFELQDEIDFSDLSDAKLTLAQITPDNKPSSFFIQKHGRCVSGKRKTLSVTIPNRFVKFRKIELSEKNITEVVSVVDTEGNLYTEVDYLTQDTVFEAIKNEATDKSEVPYVINIKPVPFRYTTEYDPISELTILTFGSGQSGIIDDDIVPDPAEFAVPFFGKKTLTRFSVNPEQFLRTRTLGTAPLGTTLTIEVRLGGGLTHNVAARSINSIKDAIVRPLTNTDVTSLNTTLATLDITNNQAAGGAEDKQTLEDIKMISSSNFTSQGRLVTREDYLARIYSIPARFGKVFKAFIKKNDTSSLSIQIHILSRDTNGSLTISPDSLKKNLKTYLNEFRMLTDSISILDASIINIGIDFEVVTTNKINITETKNLIIKQLINFFNIRNFQIGQPIILDDLITLIYSNEAIISVSQLNIKNLSGIIQGREYSGKAFNVKQNTINGIILCPEDSIFELKYPNIDIRGKTL